jgi:hypothetical protein
MTEIRVPEILVAERIDSFTKIIGRFVQWDEEAETFIQRKNAPKVDRFIAPYRSAPIALAGFREIIQNLGVESLFPPISEARGIGHEIYDAFLNDPANRDLDELLFAIHDYGESAEEDREVFWKWLQKQPPDSPIGRYIVELRQIINPEETVALLDDTYNLGTVSAGVFPGMLIAALGREHVRYAIQHNQDIFPKNGGWIKWIMAHTFGEDIDKLTRDRLAMITKGGTDFLSFQHIQVEDDRKLHTKFMETMTRLSEEAYPIIYERLRGRTSTI